MGQRLGEPLLELDGIRMCQLAAVAVAPCQRVAEAQHAQGLVLGRSSHVGQKIGLGC